MKLVTVALMLAALHVSLPAQEVEITSLSRNGVLTVTNLSLNSTCRVEWASSLEGDWRSDWSEQQSIKVTNESMSITVPMYFRVVAELNLRQGLLASYTCTGNANDDSGNARHGVVSGASLTVDRFNTTGTAYYFDGSGPYIDTFNMNAEPILTVCAWAKPEKGQPSQDTMAIVSGDNWGFDRALELTTRGVANANELEVCVHVGHSAGGADGFMRTGVFVPYGLWQHYTLQYKSNTIELFLNASLVWTYAGPAIGWDENTWHIGGNQADGFPFKGSIDDVLFYNRSLKSYEIRALMKGDASLGLLAYYPFSGNANDSTENASNGVVNGATLTTDRGGRASSAFRFDGIDDYIGILNLNAQPTLSICAWARPERGGQQDTYAIVSGDNWDFDRALELTTRGVADANALEVCVHVGESAGGLDGFVRTGIFVPFGQWRHYTVLYTADNIHVMLDGAWVWSYGAPALRWSEENWRIGGNQADGFPFKGDIDEVRIYKRALSPADVLLAMQPR